MVNTLSTILSTPPEEFVKLLADFMSEEGISQAKLARRTNTTRSNISKIFNTAKGLKRDTRLNLVNALGEKELVAHYNKQHKPFAPNIKVFPICPGREDFQDKGRASRIRDLLITLERLEPAMLDWILFELEKEVEKQQIVKKNTISTTYKGQGGAVT